MERRAGLIFALLAISTVLALAGTDLVLPAIPELPNHLQGDLTQAQWVLAGFALGTGIGLILFGELGAHLNVRYLLPAAMLGYGLISALATLPQDILTLAGIRILQGISAAAPAVFAPVIIKALYDEQQAMRKIGLMGSLESIAPALAPIAGAWLLTLFGWQSSFIVTAILAAGLSLLWLRLAPNSQPVPRAAGGYGQLLRNPRFFRLALSQACTLGGLLIFVFGAPTVLTVVLGGTLSDFIIMQVLGIAFFMTAANTAHLVVARIGAIRTILLGSALSTLGCFSMGVYAAMDGTQAEPIWVLFILVNLGLGLRGPPGFYQAILAAGQNESRGSAMIILLAMLITALGTVAVAPWLQAGLLPLASAATAVSVVSLAVLQGMTDPATP